MFGRAKAPTMLTFHYALGYLVVATALAALFVRQARRLVLYVLLLQVAAGALLWFSTGAAPPPLHWILALLGGGAYAAANAFERRGRSKAVVVGVLLAGLVLVACAFYLGMEAVRG